MIIFENLSFSKAPSEGVPRDAATAATLAVEDKLRLPPTQPGDLEPAIRKAATENGMSVAEVRLATDSVKAVLSKADADTISCFQFVVYSPPNHVLTRFNTLDRVRRRRPRKPHIAPETGPEPTSIPNRRLRLNSPPQQGQVPRVIETFTLRSRLAALRGTLIGEVVASWFTTISRLPSASERGYSSGSSISLEWGRRITTDEHVNWTL